MAHFNEILSGRLNRALQKMLSMKGDPPSPTLGGEIVPMLPMFWGAEIRYLEGWNRFGTTAALAAGGAGNFGAIRLRNPTTSGVVVIIEKANVNGALADSPRLQVAAQTLDFAVPSPTNRLDARGSQQPSSIVTTSTAGINLSATVENCFFGANSTYDFIADENQEITVLPGDAFQLISNVANQAFNATILWRERVLEDSEKT